MPDRYELSRMANSPEIKYLKNRNLKVRFKGIDDRKTSDDEKSSIEIDVLRSEPKYPFPPVDNDPFFPNEKDASGYQAGGQGPHPPQAFSSSSKKSMALCMMNLALLTSNTTQLVYILKLKGKNVGLYYDVGIVLIPICIVFQVLVGGALCHISRCNFSQNDRIDNWILMSVSIMAFIDMLMAGLFIYQDSDLFIH